MKQKLLVGIFLIGAALTVVRAPQSHASAPAQARPTVMPLPTGSAVNASIAGGRIRAQIATQTAVHGMRAVVQWRGGDARWYSVTGWQSRHIANGAVLEWWVAPRDFGTGPFRWALFAHDDVRGDNETVPVLVSESFRMPARSGESIHVVIR